jgi:hypothetical protein
MSNAGTSTRPQAMTGNHEVMALVQPSHSDGPNDRYRGHIILAEAQVTRGMGCTASVRWR